MRPIDILKKYWDYDSFRTPQNEIIDAVLAQHDVVALLPTGGGKSLCFQIPALIQPGICIVISPLIALMQDQVADLNARGIKAMMLASGWSVDQTVTAFDNLRFGKYKFLYLSPEKLQSDFIREKLAQLRVNLIAVDEAHCISEWGHDFRTAYLKVNVLKALFPQVNLIALTATATPVVLDDIRKYLEIDDALIFKKSFYRKNLHYRFLHTPDIHQSLIDYLKPSDTSIVYVKTRNATLSISRFLNRKGVRSVFYHGGMDTDEKKNNFEKWAKGKHPVMVATNAFGMGIDKSDVRAVFHVGIPQSLENFVQETGRAGRDGKASEALLLYNNNSIRDLENSIGNDTVGVDFCRDVYISLNKYFEVGLGEMPETDFDFDLEDFCRLYHFQLIKAYNALVILDREGVIEFRQDVRSRTKLRVIASGESLFDYQERNPKLKPLLHLILRSYGGVMDQFVFVDPYELSKRLHISKRKILEGLRFLDTDGIIRLKEKKVSSQIRFLVPREDRYTINRISAHIDKRNRIKKEKIRAMIEFVQDESTCRYAGILAYFGEKHRDFTCGSCDVCIKKEKHIEKDHTRIQNTILELLAEKPLDSKEIVKHLPYSSKTVLKILKWMLDNETLRLNSQYKFEINSKK